MEINYLTDLGWLPRPPENLRALCAAVLQNPAESGARLAELSRFGHDENGLAVLAKAVARARQQGIALTPLRPWRLAILSNATTDYLVPALIATGLRHGFALECIAGNYGQAMQEILTPDSAINRLRPDAVLVAMDWRGLPVQDTATAAIDYLTALQSGIAGSSGAVCIFQTLAPPPETTFGSLDRLVTGARQQVIAYINRGIEDLVRNSGSDVLLDVAGLASLTGLSRWHSPSQWNLAKIPFAQEFLPLYADHVCRLLAAMAGRARRCVVLDLDNTLWGGVIGDDGLGGIRLGQGDAIGEAYVEFQKYLLSLRDRGVVLAVSSKNEDAVARLPFREHPDMVIREEHVAVFQANWNDKASNIVAIAELLNLGLESFAFVDDNPFERELVRRALPQVAVPEMPDDAALYARALSAAGLVESVRFTEEDRNRAGYYAGNARRAAIQSQATDLPGYLASLKMEITFQPFDEPGRARITQLINKSNQFNLTTRRYTEAEVARMERDPAYFTLQVRLSDIFGDNGMISVIVCRPDADNNWEIDLWLMSCRVLGRGVETMVLRQILQRARLAGVSRLIGTYIPSGRNQIVQRHYENLGFAWVSETPDGETRWVLPTDSALPETSPMIVRVSGFLDGPAPVSTREDLLAIG